VTSFKLEPVTRWSWETKDGEFYLEADRGENYLLYRRKKYLGSFNSVSSAQKKVDKLT